MEASDFGVISPSTSTSRVSIPVARPTYAFPNTEIVSVVARAEAEILTMLLPIKMAESILEDWSRIISTLFAFLLSSSARSWICILLTVVRAVSAEEKNAEPTSKSTKQMACNIADVSKMILLYLTYRNLYCICTGDEQIRLSIVYHIGNEIPAILQILRETYFH